MTILEFVAHRSFHDLGVERVWRTADTVELILEQCEPRPVEWHVVFEGVHDVQIEPHEGIFDWAPGMDGELLSMENVPEDGDDAFKFVVLIHDYRKQSSDVGVLRGRAASVSCTVVGPT